MVIGVHIPLHAYRGPGHEGDPLLFSPAVVGCDDGPEADPCEGPETFGAEILLRDQGKRDVPEGPGSDGEIDGLISPTIFHDDADETDSTKTDTHTEVLRALGNGGTSLEAGGD